MAACVSRAIFNEIHILRVTIDEVQRHEGRPKILRAVNNWLKFTIILDTRTQSIFAAQGGVWIEYTIIRPY